jgi:hypothetical protein
VYFFFVSSLLVSGLRLDATFFNNYQDLEAEDFKEQQGARGKFYLP